MWLKFWQNERIHVILYYYIEERKAYRNGAKRTRRENTRRKYTCEMYTSFQNWFRPNEWETLIWGTTTTVTNDDVTLYRRKRVKHTSLLGTVPSNAFDSRIRLGSLPFWRLGRESVDDLTVRSVAVRSVYWCKSTQ